MLPPSLNKCKLLILLLKCFKWHVKCKKKNVEMLPILSLLWLDNFSITQKIWSEWVFILLKLLWDTNKHPRRLWSWLMKLKAMKLKMSEILNKLQELLGLLLDQKFLTIQTFSPNWLLMLVSTVYLMFPLDSISIMWELSKFWVQALMIQLLWVVWLLEELLKDVLIVWLNLELLYTAVLLIQCILRPREQF